MTAPTFVSPQANLFAREPAVVISAILGVLIGVVGFFLTLDQGAGPLVASCVAVAAVAVSVCAGYGIRSQVTAPANVEAQVTAGVIDAYQGQDPTQIGRASRAN